MDVNQIKEDYVIRNLCREAKIMSKLNHPCIVALFQTMQRSDNVYYLVTELVSGGDLCTFVKSQHNGRLEERPTRMFGRQFASALAHMHGMGVVHRISIIELVCEYSHVIFHEFFSIHMPISKKTWYRMLLIENNTVEIT
ncbi:hypothetical protein JTB14_018533 [Gonioctena quinquepunctata]|nr:hypothetical protein JTB14_018533 [Gonioctena quinquepunctata]